MEAVSPSPPWDVMAQVKEAANRIREQWRGDTDPEKAARAIAAYEQCFIPLKRAYGRDTALKLLDPVGKEPMARVSERHIRRVETIREQRPTEHAFLESLALRGLLTLERVEGFVLHPPTADTLEGIWLAADQKVQAEFLRRIGLR